MGSAPAYLNTAPPPLPPCLLRRTVGSGGSGVEAGSQRKRGSLTGKARSKPKVIIVRDPNWILPTVRTIIDGPGGGVLVLII